MPSLPCKKNSSLGRKLEAFSRIQNAIDSGTAHASAHRSSRPSRQIKVTLHERALGLFLASRQVIQQQWVRLTFTFNVENLPHVTCLVCWCLCSSWSDLWQQLMSGGKKRHPQCLAVSAELESIAKTRLRLLGLVIVVVALLAFMQPIWSASIESQPLRESVPISLRSFVVPARILMTSLVCLKNRQWGIRPFFRIGFLSFLSLWSLRDMISGSFSVTEAFLVAQIYTWILQLTSLVGLWAFPGTILVFVRAVLIALVMSADDYAHHVPCHHNSHLCIDGEYRRALATIIVLFSVMLVVLVCWMAQIETIRRVATDLSYQVTASYLESVLTSSADATCWVTNDSDMTILGRPRRLESFVDRPSGTPPPSLEGQPCVKLVVCPLLTTSIAPASEERPSHTCPLASCRRESADLGEDYIRVEGSKERPLVLYAPNAVLQGDSSIPLFEGCATIRRIIVSSARAIRIDLLGVQGSLPPIVECRAVAFHFGEHYTVEPSTAALESMMQKKPVKKLVDCDNFSSSGLRASDLRRLFPSSGLEWRCMKCGYLNTTFSDRVCEQCLDSRSLAQVRSEAGGPTERPPPARSATGMSSAYRLRHRGIEVRKVPEERALSPDSGPHHWESMGSNAPANQGFSGQNVCSRPSPFGQLSRFRNIAARFNHTPAQPLKASAEVARDDGAVSSSQ